MSSFVRESVIVNGRPLTLETGRIAKQAHGAVLITYGESMVLVTAVSSQEAALTSDTMTLAPSRANANADARPMPLPAPVTRATLPSNSEVDISFSS